MDPSETCMMTRKKIDVYIEGKREKLSSNMIGEGNNILLNHIFPTR